jgi:hypothetical protein
VVNSPWQFSITKVLLNAPHLLYTWSGMVLGDRFKVLEIFDWIKELDSVLISFEFRNSPENAQSLVEDCLAGLT